MNPLSAAAWVAALFLAANLFPHSIALRLTMLALGLALVAFELARAKLAGRPAGVQALPPLLVPILLWAAWAALSILWSVEPDRSMKEYKNEVVYVFLGYWLCWVAAQAPGARRAFGIVLGAGAALICFIGLYGYLSPMDHLWIERLTSGPGDQSSALLTLMPLVLIAIWLARAEKASPSLQRALWVLPILMLAAAYATLNRTVWIGFAVELVVMGALLLPRAEFSGIRTLARFRLLAAALAVAIVTATTAVIVHVQQQRSTLGTFSTLKKDWRLELWPYVIKKIEERPLLGFGFGRGIERDSLHEEFDEGNLWHAHNIVLDTAVQLGLVGAVLLALLLGSTAWRAWRLVRGFDSLAACYGAALIAVIAGNLVRNMTDVLLVRQNALLYWGMVGALLAWCDIRRRPAAGSPRRSASTRVSSA